MNEYCSYCGKELEYVDNEWAKYNFSDCEEIVSIYECIFCKKRFTKRDGNFNLEERVD